MRIAFLSSVFSFGGAQMSSIELAVRLSPEHDVKFFDTYGCSEPYINELKSNKIQYSLLSESSVPFIISKYKNRLFNIFRYLLFFFKWKRIKQNTKSELDKFQPEIVIVYDDRCLSYLIRYKNKRFRTIFYARGWYISEQISLKTKILLKNYVDEIICISEATRHAMFCSGIASLDKIFVVHNSINVNKLKAEKKIMIENKDSVFNIILSGGFIPTKGQHVALQAAKILKKRNIDFHMYLCGIIYPGHGHKSENYYMDLLNYVKVNELESVVSFIVGKNNIISYIKYCDIMLFPSSSEGLPRSVLEAMALGKPVVANAVGGVTDLILDRFTGYLTKYNDPHDYAKYAILLYENKSLYNEISKNAIKLIKTSFNENLQINKMNEIFK